MEIRRKKIYNNERKAGENEVIKAGKDFVAKIKDPDVKKITIPMVNNEFNKEDYKKSLLLFAKGINNQTRENRGKSPCEGITILNAAGFDDNELESLSYKEKLKSGYYLFNASDFSYTSQGDLYKSDGNGIMEDKDLAALIAYLDSKDGKRDGIIYREHLNKMVLKCQFAFKSCRKSLEKTALEFKF